MAWDPLSFVKEQQYTERPAIALERAITFTNCANDTQATTTATYLSQMWPATRRKVMEFVIHVIRNTLNSDHDCILRHLRDGTALEGHINGKEFLVTATGTCESIAELMQQFAWLGAALRSSPFEANIALCSPTIRISQTKNNERPLEPKSKPLDMVSIICVIEFEMDKCPKNVDEIPGQYWHNMVRNPVLVSGYPILAKEERGVGLEMPLNMTAGLGGTERANEFDGKVFIKGFSIMLIAIKIAKDLLICHYLYNRNGERISYLDHALETDNDISWSSECKYFAGAVDVDYNIRGTSLPKPHSGCLLEKASISVGKIAIAGESFAVGVKDVSLHATPKYYIHRLRWIATKYVVLWDEEDKRGWLVNGISALLHLVRASLEAYRTDEFCNSFLFNEKDMNDAAEHKPYSAIQVLIDPKNRGLRINDGGCEEVEEETKQKGDVIEKSNCGKLKRSYYRFQDLVDERFNMMELAMEHQKRALGQNGVNVKVRLRKHLDGWDFVELAKDHDPIPRVATLHALGYGWVDFIHSIEAITLLGRGFGGIIQPRVSDGMCPNWKRLPMNRYYLGASVTDVKNITDKFGKDSANSVQVCHKLYCHCPGGDMIKQ